MNIRFKLILITGYLLLVSGCAGVTTPTLNPPGVESTVATEPTEVPSGEVVIEAEPKPIMSANRAVVALLDRADADNRAGKQEAAGASLERALRIEPRNPWLWHELALVRISEGKYAQAITLAKKSNSFAARQPRLLSENWQAIGQAKVALGDTAGAEQAFKFSSEFAIQIGSTKQ